MKTEDENLKNEERIVWVRDPSPFPYLRESRFSSQWRARRPAWGYTLIAYSTHKRHKNYDIFGGYTRRVWWLKPYDVGMPENHPGERGGYNSKHGPSEAVVTASVRAGMPSRHFPDYGAEPPKPKKEHALTFEAPPNGYLEIADTGSSVDIFSVAADGSKKMIWEGGI